MVPRKVRYLNILMYGYSYTGELRNGAAAKMSIETGDPVAHFWCLAVDPEYKGNKIANSLIRGALELLKGTSYKYATIGAFNYFTKRAAEYNGFEAVHSITVKDFLWKGAHLYSSVEEPHGVITRLMKNLQ